MSDSLYEEARDIDQEQFDGPVTEDAGCDVAPQEWGHVSTEVLMERVTAGIISDSGDDTTQERADAALTELAERLKAAETKWYAAAPFRANWLQALEARDRAVAQRDELVEAASKTLHYVDGRAVLKHEPGICPLCDALAKVRR